jgi:RHS repeat-associated protein
MGVRRGCEVEGDKAGAGGHGVGMRWVLMLLVILAAVMGGEALAVVVMGRAVVSERVGKEEMVERESEALRVESERAFLGAGEVTGLVDGGPLVCWFPGGSAVARSFCDTDEALEWDGENRLTGMWRGPWKEELAQVPFESLVGQAVEGSTVWRWGYDHRSRRVQRDEPGSGGERLRTVTVFSGGTSAAEYTETAAAGSAWTVPLAATVQHVRGPDLGGGTKGLLYSLRNGLPTFNRYNGRGDVVAQSDIDGTTTWAASYQADGRRTAEAGTNVERHRACTKEEDPTGLLNEGFRYRDMETGTFISRDPLGHVDGPNVYCYVRQNPWTMWDPEGLESYSWYKGGWLRQNLVDPIYNTARNVRTDSKTTLTGLGTGMIDGAIDLAYISQRGRFPMPAVVSRAQEMALGSIKNLVDTTAADLVGVDPDSSTFRDANTTGAILLPMPGGAASTAAVRGATAAVRGAKALAGIGALAKAIATAPLKESAQLAAKPIVRELAEKAAAKGVDTGLGPHAPGGVPDAWPVVKGGTKPPPAPGEVFSTSYGRTLNEAGAGVPHGQIQPTTAGQIRAGGGSVDVAPEMTGTTMNYQHANVIEGRAPTVFQPPIPNPVPKPNRIGGPNYGN